MNGRAHTRHWPDNATVEPAKLLPTTDRKTAFDNACNAAEAATPPLPARRTR